MITLFLSMLVISIIAVIVLGVLCAFGLVAVTVLLPFIDLMVFGFIIFGIYKVIAIIRR